MACRICHITVFVICVAVTAAASDRYSLLCEEAKELAKQPFRKEAQELPVELKQLSYDQLRTIVFRHDRAWWAAERLPYRLEFFHPGGLNGDVVELFEIDHETTHSIRYSPDFFDFRTNRLSLKNIPGFAGFRILDSRSQEVASFLNASYFRMVGLGQWYGTSARGLAIDTAYLGHEEFPVFRKFWIRKPAKKAREIAVYALLDSASATGAFEFIISGGIEVTAKVNATIFPRRELRDFGITPLSTMFWFDDSSPNLVTDFRREVHDADGLLLHTSRDQWLWRPFEQGRMARFNVYSDDHVRGFGVIQRDRNFDHYRDLEARYHLRPSIWIEPIGDWDKGALTLLQLPTENEYADNVAVYWKPAVTPKPGESLNYRYAMRWSTNEFAPKTLGIVRSTHLGRVNGKLDGNLRFVIEFTGRELEQIARRGELEHIVKTADDIQILSNVLIRNDMTRSQRLVFDVKPPERAVDFTAYLSSESKQVTETWSYTWQP